MKPRALALAAAAAVASWTGSAGAQTHEACQQFAWSIERERTAFAGAQLPTIGTGGQYPGLLEGVSVSLEPQAGVAYPVPPARPPRKNPAYGAVLTAAPVAVAGSYQVTLSEDAWIDLVQNGARLKSTSFSGKTGCPGVRKSVRFSLTPGPLSIEISDSTRPTLHFDLLPAE